MGMMINWACDSIYDPNRGGCCESWWLWCRVEMFYYGANIQLIESSDEERKQKIVGGFFVSSIDQQSTCSCATT
jgi:hypothetical protein